MRKIRSGDTVLVTSGRNKGQQGKERVNMIERDRVVIEGVNIVKKHIKRGRARQAGIVEVEAPVHESNVRPVCPNCKHAARVGERVGTEGQDVRYWKDGAALI